MVNLTGNRRRTNLQGKYECEMIPSKKKIKMKETLYKITTRTFSKTSTNVQ